MSNIRRPFSMVFAVFALIWTCHSMAKGEKRPVYFVHGGAAQWIVRMDDLQDFFVEDGYLKQDLHLLRYKYASDVDPIKNSLAAQIKTIMAKYPKSTKFDIVGHSLGAFVAFYTILEAELTHRISHFISLGGMVRGVDRESTFVKNFYQLFKGKTARRLVPYMNDFIVALLNKHKVAIANLDKCALFSYDDVIVNKPYESGAFEDGSNLGLNGFSHLDFIHSHDIYVHLKEVCYKN